MIVHLLHKKRGNVFYLLAPIIIIILFYYSVLKATTGSFLAALLEGMKPAINDNAMLIKINMIAALTGK